MKLYRSSRGVMFSCLIGGSTSVRLFAPNMNLPRNSVALFLALVKRDSLYLEMLTGVLLVVGHVVQGFDAGGGDGCGSSKPSAGMISGGSVGAVVGRGGSVRNSRLNRCCVGGKGPGENDGPAWCVAVGLCPPKNPSFCTFGSMCSSCYGVVMRMAPLRGQIIS